MTEQDGIDLLRRDHTSLAATVGNLTIEMRLIKDYMIEMQTDRAVRTERDKNLHDRLGRIEKSIEVLEAECKKDFDKITSIGKWILTAFAVVLIAAIGNFIINGGLGAIPTP